MKLIIEDDEGRKTVVPIVREEIEITIGRHEENTIRLTERNVSRRHAKLIRKNGAVWVEDLGSYNGVRVNGDRIAGRVQVKEGDLIQIGDYDLAVQIDGAPRPEGAAAHSPAAAAHAVHPHAAVHAAAPAHGAAARAEAPAAAHHPAPAPAGGRRYEPTAVIHIDQVQKTRRDVVDIPPDQAPKLLLTTTEVAGREYACIRSELTIGRADDNDIAIDHRSLSRNHCKVYRGEDGAWKVIDLQSANGVRVNGEAYAEVPLRTGDSIELGHVKFKFILPGDELVTEAVEPTGRKLPPKLVMGLVGGAFALGGVITLVVLLSSGGSTEAAIPAKPVAGPLEPIAVSPPKPATAPPGPGTLGPDRAPRPPEPAVIAEPGTPELVAPPLAAPAASEARQAYDLGLKYLGERRFAEAAREFERATEGGIGEAAEQLEAARSEVGAKASLGEAQEKLAKKDFDGARSAAGRVPEKSAFAAEARKVADRAARDIEREAKKAAAPPAPKPDKKGAPSSKADGREAAQKYVDQAADLLRRQQPKEAAVFLEKAIKADPSRAELHKYLGSAYAQTGDHNRAAIHYRKYIQAYPNAPDAAAIRENLRAYEESLKSAPEGSE